MKPLQKNKSDMLSALAGNIPAEVIAANAPKPAEVKSAKPSTEDLVRDSEEDYRFTRDRVKKLAETSDEAIAIMLNLATDSEHPRAFEVLANLIKTAADVNNQLTTIQKDRKKLNTDPVKKGEIATVTSTTNNNVIFTGTTSDLQKFLADRKKASEMIVDA
jgi:hypothetical protein